MRLVLLQGMLKPSEFHELLRIFEYHLYALEQMTWTWDPARLENVHHNPLPYLSLTLCSCRNERAQCGTNAPVSGRTLVDSLCANIDQVQVRLMVKIIVCLQSGSTRKALQLPVVLLMCHSCFAIDVAPSSHGMELS